MRQSGHKGNKEKTAQRHKRYSYIDLKSQTKETHIRKLVIREICKDILFLCTNHVGTYVCLFMHICTVSLDDIKMEDTRDERYDTCSYIELHYVASHTS